MKRIAFFVCLLWVAASFASYDTISVVGHIPGAASMSVEFYDNILYAGAGASLFIYECEDPAEMTLLSYVNFYSIVNHILVRGDGIVFVGANRDALYAIDATIPESPEILARYRMPSRNYAVADIELTGEDTVWLCDYNSLKQLYFTGDSFLLLDEFFTGLKIVGADFRDNLAVISRRGVMWLGQGFVELYDRSAGGFDHITTFSSPRLTYMCDAQFADNRDDIIYVLGGSPNLGGDGDFFALHYDGTALNNVAQHRWSGMPGGFAQVFIMNMDSRNDTVYLATMAGVFWDADSPWTTCPVLDGTHLPDSMPIVANFVPGLWFFDVALHDSHPALATASEWLGVFWTNTSDFSRRTDTIRTYPTGGWGMSSQLYEGDTLYVAQEGYGVGIYDVRDKTNPLLIGNIPGSFAWDIAFLDSIICVARSSQNIFYNLAPWRRGGEIEPLDTFMLPRVLFEVHVYQKMSLLQSETDTMFVFGVNFNGILMVDPHDLPDVYPRQQFFNRTHPAAIHAESDTIFYLTADSLYIVRFLGDTVEHILHIHTGGSANDFCKTGSFIGITRKAAGIKWFEWSGSTATEIGSWNPWGDCNDCAYFDSLLYVSTAAGGLFVLDIADFPDIDTLAWFPGSQGWEYLQFGTQHIHFGPDSTIYLADYHAGAFILEPFHRGSLEIVDTDRAAEPIADLRIYPNPFNSAVHVDAPEGSTVEIFDIGGRRIADFNRSTIKWKPDINTASGVYHIRVTGKNDEATVRRVVFIK